MTNEIKLHISRLATLSWTFFKIGFFTFGGGLAMIPFIVGEFVDKKKWLTADEMTDMIALAQSFPGVISVNVSILVGHKVASKSGAVCAVIGTVLPAFISIVLILTLLAGFEDNEWVRIVFVGIKAASAALIFEAVYRMARKALRQSLHWIIAAAALIVVMLGFSAAWSVVLGAVAGMVFFHKKKTEEAKP